MRKLIIARIVHTPSDMGSMQSALTKEGMSKIGLQRWEENQRRIDRFWNELESEIDSLGLDLSKVRVYQDGLPAGGDLGRRIVNETAQKGSRNYRIVQRLMDGGATIEASESPQLLKQEYDYIRAILEAKAPEEKKEAEAKYNQAARQLLLERDAFIARAVDSSLRNGEVGLLFIGAHHNVASKLPSDIDVKMLD
jgi:hypothetical protein